MFLFVIMVVLGVPAGAASLTLARTFPLGDIQGRIDHFGYDPVGSRLFVAALGNNTVEVVDLKQDKVVHSISGLSEPQGIFYVPEFNRLYVANGGDGALRVYDGTDFSPLTVLNSTTMPTMCATTRRRYKFTSGTAAGRSASSTPPKM